MKSGMDEHSPTNLTSQKGTHTLPDFFSLLIDESWPFFKAHFSQYIPFYAIPAFCLMWASLLIQLSQRNILSEQQTVLLLLPLVLLFIFGYLAFLIALKGQDQNNSQILKKTLNSYFPFLLLSLFFGLLIFVGLLLLVVPGIIFIAWYYCASYVYVAEDCSIREAFVRSKQYCIGKSWQVLWRILALFFFSFSALLIVNYIFSFIFLTIFGIVFWTNQSLDPDLISYFINIPLGFAANLILVSLHIIYGYILYKKLRMMTIEL